jgi:hypothetical protein
VKKQDVVTLLKKTGAASSAPTKAKTTDTQNLFFVFGPRRPPAEEILIRRYPRDLVAAGIHFVSVGKT